MPNPIYTNVRIINQNNPNNSVTLQIPNSEITGTFVGASDKAIYEFLIEQNIENKIVNTRLKMEKYTN